MNKAEVRRIIESTLASGNKTPGLLALPKILVLKNRLESCASIGGVIEILKDNRSLICKSFGLSDAIFYNGLEKLMSVA